MGIAFDTFIKQHLGKAVDVDGTAGVQCVDLAKAYLREVYDVPFFSVGSARNYFEKFTSYPALKAKFVRIENTPDFVPAKGDIAVWNGTKGGGHGHVALCAGEGDKHYFYSYDQNWDGKACKLVRHDYKGFLGVLRPRYKELLGDLSGTKDKFYPKYNGSSCSIVDALASLKIDASYRHRCAIAKANGIKRYVGTAEQNIKMLTLLTLGKLKEA